MLKTEDKCEKNAFSCSQVNSDVPICQTAKINLANTYYIYHLLVLLLIFVDMLLPVATFGET